jgi:hypothetical protein
MVLRVMICRRLNLLLDAIISYLSSAGGPFPLDAPASEGGGSRNLVKLQTLCTRVFLGHSLAGQP